MVNVYPTEASRASSLEGPISGGKRHPKISRKQSSILGNILGPAFDPVTEEMATKTEG